MDKTIKVKDSKNGLGAFAGKRFKPNEDITEITGNIVHWKTLLSIGGVILDNTYRYDEDEFLSPDGVGNYINHSCEPNCGIIKRGNKLYLKAIRTIKVGEEIVFDYSTIVGGDDKWTMQCSCGSKTCREKVTNFYKLPSDLQHRYLDLQIVPKYIINTK